MSTLATHLSDLTGAALLPIIGERPKRICLLDPPAHSNVGDSAILIGELDFLRRHYPDAEIMFFDGGNYSESCDRFIEGADILLLHGGGNFGDLYPYHHAFRLKVLQRFPSMRIVQFPQSVCFEDPSSLQTTAEVIRQHRDFWLFVRDENSLEFCSANFVCETRLCPDMAYSMNPIHRAQPTVDYLCLLRADKEVAIDHEAALQYLSENSRSVEVQDWLVAPRSVVHLGDKLLSRAWLNCPISIEPTRTLARHLREHHARRRVSVGVDILSRGRRVVTDRLHAHILSCLLGVEHFVFDSLDGKVGAYYQTWTKDEPVAHFVRSMDEFAGLVSTARLH